MKYLQLFDSFNIISLPDDETKFLKRVKEKNPNLYNRFYSLVKNKGLQFATDSYIQYDKELQKEIDKKNKIKYSFDNKDSYREILPDQKFIKNLIDTYVLSDKFKELCDKLGLPHKYIRDNVNRHLRSGSRNGLISYNYYPKINKYTAEIKSSLFFDETFNFSLYYLVKLLNCIGSGYSEINTKKSLNPFKINLKLSADIKTNFEFTFNLSLNDTSYDCTLKLDMSYNTNEYSPTSFSRKTLEDFKLLDSEINTNTEIEIPKLFEEDKIILTGVKIKELTKKCFHRLQKDVLSKYDNAIHNCNKFEEFLIKTILEILYDNSNDIFTNIKIIENHYPNAFNKLKPFFKTDSVNTAMDMGDMGF